MDKDRTTSVDLFAELPDEQVEKLAGTANEWSASKGDTLIQREDSAFQLFAIEDGSVEVCKEQEKLATVGKGEVVGEIGVAKRGVRKASVEVAEDAKGFFLTNSQVEMLRREADGFEERLKALVEKRGF
ncbi:MAG: cyclic nucleotide-binding domain-containing protein [Thermoleophilaceae bacterium]